MLPDPTDPRGRIEVEAARVASRLGALGPVRAPVDLMRAAVADLVRLQWEAEGLPGGPPAISVAPHGWADVVRVVAADLAGVAGDPPQLAPAADLLTRLRRELP